MCDKIKNHPVILWTLRVLLTALDCFAVILSGIIGYEIYLSLAEEFKLSTFLFLVVPVICILGAILLQGRFYKTFIDD